MPQLKTVVMLPALASDGTVTPRIYTWTTQEDAMTMWDKAVIPFEGHTALLALSSKYQHSFPITLPIKNNTFPNTLWSRVKGG